MLVYILMQFMVKPKKSSSDIAKCIEWLRIGGVIGGVICGFYFVYNAHSDGDVIQAARPLTLVLGIALCGTCAIEGIFFAKASALEKGFDSASAHSSQYQRQSALWFVTGTIVSVIVFVWYPETSAASLIYLLFVSIFLGLSAINHAYKAVCHRNVTWQNLNRPFLFIALIAATVPVIRGVLQ
jgi:hypothetical protein